MCEPISATTLTWLAVGATVASAGATYYTQNKAADYSRGVAKNNEIMALRAAKDAIRRGRVEEINQRRRNAAELSTARADLSARGLDLGAGSAADALVGSAGVYEEEALAIRANAAREAFAYRQQAAGFRSEQSLIGAQNRAANIGLGLNTLGSVTQQLGGLNSTPRSSRITPSGSSYTRAIY